MLKLPDGDYETSRNCGVRTERQFLALRTGRPRSAPHNLRTEAAL